MLDDEVVVLGVSGKDANVDLAHNRFQCAVKPFKNGPHPQNRDCCLQCHCYVCDVSASQCKYWGQGANDADHCHAHDTFDWRLLRKLKRQKGEEHVASIWYESYARPGRFCPSVPAPITVETNVSPLPSACPPPATPPVCRQPAPGSTASSTLKELPNPAADQRLVALGQLELVVRASGTSTLESLQHRISRFGYCHSKQLENELKQNSDKLCMYNLFDGTDFNAQGEFEGSHVTVTCSGPGWPEVNSSHLFRRRRVVLVEMESNMKTSEVAVKLNPDFKVSTLLNAIVVHLKTSLTSDHELVMVIARHEEGKPDTYTVPALEETLYGTDLKHSTIYVYKTRRAKVTNRRYQYLLAHSQWDTNDRVTAGIPLLLTIEGGTEETVRGGLWPNRHAIAGLKEALQKYAVEDTSATPPFALYKGRFCYENNEFRRHMLSTQLGHLASGIWMLYVVWSTAKRNPYDMKKFRKLTQHTKFKVEVDAENIELDKVAKEQGGLDNGKRGILRKALEELKALSLPSINPETRQSQPPLIAVDVQLELLPPEVPPPTSIETATTSVASPNETCQAPGSPCPTPTGTSETSAEVPTGSGLTPDVAAMDGVSNLAAHLAPTTTIAELLQADLAVCPDLAMGSQPVQSTVPEVDQTSKSVVAGECLDGPSAPSSEHVDTVMVPPSDLQVQASQPSAFASTWDCPMADVGDVSDQQAAATPALGDKVPDVCTGHGVEANTKQQSQSSQPQSSARMAPETPTKPPGDTALVDCPPSQPLEALPSGKTAGPSTPAEDITGSAAMPGAPVPVPKGLLKIKVFTWKNKSISNPCIFRRAEEWAGVTNGRSPEAEMPLRHVMMLIAEKDPMAGKAVSELLLLEKDDVPGADRSLTTLMKVIETPEVPPAPQPAGLTVTLKPYQLQSLQLMIDNEELQGGLRDHFWFKMGDATAPYFYSPALDRVAWSVAPTSWGGYLAEEMGLGKTVEILALVLSRPPPRSLVPGSLDMGGKYNSKATLVVCAVSLVGQWVAEAQSKLEAPLAIHEYHGPSRCRHAHVLARRYDLVVTTYSILTSDFNKLEDHGPLWAINWHRIVFDEGHCLKGYGAHGASLVSDRRWACSSTPINTSIDDLYQQFVALKVSPLTKKGCFDLFVKTPYTWPSHRVAGLGASAAAFHHMLSKIMIRHTKEQVVNGEAILQLPEKEEVILKVKWSEGECKAYLDRYRDINAKWQEYRQRGAGHVNARQLVIRSCLLLPLRQLCSGGSTESFSSSLEGSWSGTSVAAMPVSNTTTLTPETTCAICGDGGSSMEHPVVTPCGHVFCFECLAGWFTSAAYCPSCKMTASVNDLKRVRGANGSEVKPMSYTSVTYDTKLKVLVGELKAMRAADPSAKALIFSNFNLTLSWLKERLPQEGFQTRTITGSMPMKQRCAAIRAFQQDPPTTVFLLAVKSAAVGINLTAANHVFLMEPCLNPALEAQAIGRAWRMGQVRKVKVVKLCVQGSVEDKIVEVVKAKQNGGVGMGSDLNLAGNISEDKAVMNLKEMDLLFSTPELS